MTCGIGAKIEPKETRGKGRKSSRSKDMLSALVGIPNSRYHGYVRGTLEEVEGRTTELESSQDKLHKQVAQAFNANANVI
ncbi:hypothetical protein J1N35_037174 [Gossypium stocksii]|uniref:Uncharacterized protein n=1 Tax=Gossypium stocksii TaxID=47602 RepID=A0A9D3UJD7_9ROSI|nr:hypothetical protein J1N35_037174 [Gossypium stocksii]